MKNHMPSLKEKANYPFAKTPTKELGLLYWFLLANYVTSSMSDWKEPALAL